MEDVHVLCIKEMVCSPFDFLGYEVEEVMSASNQVNCGRSMCVGASFTDMYYVCVCECVCILYVCGCA